MFGVGDMDIHKRITPRLIQARADVIRQSSLVLADGNPPQETLGNESNYGWAGYPAVPDYPAGFFILPETCNLEYIFWL